MRCDILHGFPEKPKRRKSKKADCVRCIPLFSLPPFAGRVRGKPPAAHDHANGFRRFSKWRHRKQYCPSDLPLRFIPPTPAVWAPPAYGRGWPGSSGQHRLRPAYPLMHSQTCPEAPADAIHRNPSVLLHPLGCTCGSPLTDWRTIRNGRPAPSPLDLHGKQRAWKRPMYLSVESAQPLSRSVHMQNRGQTERPWRALCGISACSPLGEKASERGSNTFWGTFSVGGAAL